MEQKMQKYQPRQEQAAILDRAMTHIKAVPYRVTARWLFYRLLQDGIYQEKEDYHGRFLPLAAKARKNFYSEWRPWTLADDTREAIPGGEGFYTPFDWLEAVRDYLKFEKVKWLNQKHYVEIWFEAAAMVGQFRHYTEEIPLLAFHGDVSIPEKWVTAKRLEKASQQYELPIVVIYFGDDDDKGWAIPQSALADIREWCDAEFKFVRGGLNKGDAERLGIPGNPEKPNNYQWEALDDKQAGQLITDTVGHYYSREVLAAVREEEDQVTKKFHDKFEGFIDDWDSLEEMPL